MVARERRPVAKRARRTEAVTMIASRRRGGEEGEAAVREPREAVRSVGWCSLGWEGKKVRKSMTLSSLAFPTDIAGVIADTNINIKQPHCNPICAIPSSAAAHSPPDTSLQHLTSALLAGRTRMFPMAAMLERPPRRTHQGERPSELRRVMILRCWGR